MGNPSKKCVFVYVGQAGASYMLAGKRDYSMKREPQIGFAYLSAVLRERGVDSEILDFTITPYTAESLNAYLAKERPLFVGFYAAAAMKSYVLEFLRAVRRAWPGLKIFLGGPDLYDCESYLRSGGDVFCLGEGERTMGELLDWCEGKKDLAEIKGIAYLAGDEVKRTAPWELIKDLDELPLPAWDKFDLNNYYDYHVFDMVQPYVPIMASRGCPFQCTYCISHKIWEQTYRRRSPANVLREIDYLVRERGVKFIKFQDDIWSWPDDAWAKEICEGLIKRAYDLKWRCILHPFSFLKSRQEILPLMRRSGCTAVNIGLQSASKKILKNINRSPAQPEALAGLIRDAKKAGLVTNIEFIFGLPGETEETVEENIQYAIKNRPTTCGFYVLTVLKGSDIWQAHKEGKLPKSSLSEQFLQKKCQEAARRFYTNPRVAFNIFLAVLRADPKWFLRAAGHAKYLLQNTGIFGKKEQTRF